MISLSISTTGSTIIAIAIIITTELTFIDSIIESTAINTIKSTITIANTTIESKTMIMTMIIN